MFIIIVLATMYIVYWAAQETKTAADFYAAHEAITGEQSVWAVAGDQMSAASLLAIARYLSLQLYGYSVEHRPDIPESILDKTFEPLLRTKKIRGGPDSACPSITA